MCEVEFKRSRLHLTVATLVSAVGFPHNKGQYPRWTAGRDKSRKGVHPDIMFTCTGSRISARHTCELHRAIDLLDTNDVEAFTATLDELEGKSVLKKHRTPVALRVRYLNNWRKRRKPVQGKKPEDEPNLTIGSINGFLEASKTTVSRALGTLGCLLNLVRNTAQQESVSHTISAARILARAFPSGIAVLTLSIDFGDDGLTDTKVDQFLTKLDPRRRIHADEASTIQRPELPPDLLSLLDAMLLHLRFGALSPKEWHDFKVAADKDNFDIHVWNSSFGTRMVNLGSAVRVEPQVRTAPNNTRETYMAQMLPYVLLDCDIADRDFWMKGSALRSEKHRRIFHTAVGSYLPLGSRSEHIPDDLRPPTGEDVLSSLSWSDNSMLFGSTRGSGLFFASGDTDKEWTPVAVEYRQAILDAIENVVGMWAALGTLNVHVDGILRRIGGKPLENEPALSEVESARMTLTFLLGEPSMYQLEGGSILTFQGRLRDKFRIDYLRDLLFQKFESVKDLHDLQMHLTALRQIRKENAPYDRS